jgi:glyoxylase-like metal-dependent hydrolase (beta-lactamase superfamily II)
VQRLSIGVLPVSPTQLELPVPWLGSVNVWLLEGDVLTLVDTGPSNERAAAALDAGLARHGHAVEDIELVLVTHHHLDHSGLASAIKERSGARVAAHRRTAEWGRDYHARVAAERRFTERLLAAHGVPQARIEEAGPFFDYIATDSADYTVDTVLSDGDKVRAGDRTLRVVFRPGHSTTDTLFVDEDSGDAFVGDHLLATITTGAEIMPTELPGTERRRALLEYLSNLRATRAMQLATCYAGHGPPIHDHRALIDERIAFHSERLDRVAELVRDGCTTAFEVARRLWSEDIARTQPVLVTWEVLGHLDILVNRGTVKEDVDAQGCHRFVPKETVEVARAS